MAVREALLALLTAAPAYGFALHGGLAERTGGRREVNVGQTYATLERAAKAGLIESAGSTPDGLPLHRLTASGLAVATAWIEGADASGADPWDETVDRVLIAASLPATPLGAIVAAERSRWLARLAASSGPAEPAAGLRRLAVAAEAAKASAALAWLDEVASAEASGIDLAFAPSAERPRRGRRRGSGAAAVVDDGTTPADQESASA